MRGVALRVLGLALLGAGLGACRPAFEPATSAVLAGTVTYRERMALLPGSVVELRLVDVTDADAPAVVLAQQSIAAGQRQVPISFGLRYPAARIDARGRYALRASIYYETALLFTTRQDTEVLVAGAPTSDVELVLERFGRRADFFVTSGPWRLEAIREPGRQLQPVGPDVPYTIEFSSNGRYSGQAHCNRYTGSYEVPEPAGLALAAPAATLAACSEPSIAGEFLRALGAVTRYGGTPTGLRLFYGDDGVLRFTRAALPMPAPPPEVARTFVFDCDGTMSFTMRTGENEIALFAPAALGGQAVVLPAAVSGSGARYTDGETVFWNKGNFATIEIGGRTFVDCVSNPSKVPWADAARRGATFRALGNEPAWNLEVHANRLILVTDLGATQTELELIESAVDGSRTTYRAAGGGHNVTAVVEQRPCADTMSGEGFEAAATVTFDATVYEGCGRFL